MFRSEYAASIEVKARRVAASGLSVPQDDPGSTSAACIADDGAICEIWDG